MLAASASISEQKRRDFEAVTRQRAGAVLAYCLKEEVLEMNNVRIIVFAFIGVLGLTLQQAKADEMNQKTTIKFSGPVEIPGQVLLPGTYVLKVADSIVDRNIIQVFNKDETHLYGTFLAIPDYRLKRARKTIITFEERVTRSPEAVLA
jgi:hypothetical protein